MAADFSRPPRRAQHSIIQSYILDTDLLLRDKGQPPVTGTIEIPANWVDIGTIRRTEKIVVDVTGLVGSGQGQPSDVTFSWLLASDDQGSDETVVGDLTVDIEGRFLLFVEQPIFNVFGFVKLRVVPGNNDSVTFTAYVAHTFSYPSRR